MEEIVVSMKNICKVYPNGVMANKDVNLDIRRGEIHALMGENGAGKSTLMKMLFGLEQPTSGEIWLNGEKVVLPSPNAAIGHGIGMVHQHFMLVPSLTVAENIVLGMVPRKSQIFVDIKKAVKITEEYSERFNLRVDPMAKVADIPVGMKQKVEILKALVRGAKILILDEPTAVLTKQETTELFKELLALKKHGYTLIFISHKLQEIMEITDRLTILRGGHSMGVYNTCDVSPAEISRLMVGRDVLLNVTKTKAQPQKVVLQVRDLNYVNEWGKRMLDNISFSVRQGEILGIAGVEGNGQKELVDMLFGLNRPDSGTITVNGEKIIGMNQRKLRDRHISLVPEDRMLYGIAAEANIVSNTLSDRLHNKKYNAGPLFKMRALQEETDELIKEYRVLCKNREQNVGMLSGGNIQKVVVAREFSNSPQLIIADQPTRGIDVGATEFIRQKLVELARSGVAVLLVSADLNEVMELSDSLIVMYGGHITGYFKDSRELDDEKIGKYMLGLAQQSAEEITGVCYE